MSNKRRKVKREDQISAGEARREDQRREIVGILLLFLSLLGFWSLWRGSAEAGLGHYLHAASVLTAGGSLAFVPILYVFGIGLYLLLRHRQPGFGGAWLGLALLCLVILSGFDLISHETTWSSLTNGEGGGALGGIIALLAAQAFGIVGAWLFLAAVSLIAVILMTGRSLVALFALLKPARRPIRPPAAMQTSADKPEAERIALRAETGIPRSVTASPSSPQSQSGQETCATTVQLHLDFPYRGYTLPSVELLNRPRTLKLTRAPQDQRRQLEETLASFGIQAKVIEVHRGPVITRYDLQPAAGVKVSRIVSLADDLALALAARGLRIEAPIPGKAALGIEVPNKEPALVILREVLESKEFAAAGILSFVLGRDIAGEIVLGDLSRMPHLLVAGTTGSGKSVCLNTIIMSLLFKAGPDRIKMIMIDPKMVELTAYNGIPHLIAPVVSEAKRAPAALKWAVTEMERRYRLMMEAGCREIDAYNRAQADPDLLLPYIIICIDELADLMMIARIEVEDTICRLAQMARATGLYLVIATQRPSVDVITGLIKANIPSRIAFAVSSLTDSRTILDSGGAERLLGRGDMLYAPVGVMKPRRVQGALVSDEEVVRVVEFWRAQAEPKQKTLVFKEDESTGQKDPAVEDDLFWDAVQVVVDFHQASASILQRRLRVGYSRAARLIDLMEARGFVGSFEGSKPRAVRITTEQLAVMRERS